MIEHANFYYFRRISKIGGTEQFLYEMAKKYCKYDLAILFDEADYDQLMRLKKLVPCYRRKVGEIYKCERAFYNFNLEAIEQIEAKEHIFIAHAIYQEIPLLPPLAEKRISRWIGVSKYACEELKKYGKEWGIDIEPELCYNPLELEEPKKVVRLISACRLNDKVKGGLRTLKLIEALDDYCEKSGCSYIWSIFTNNVDFKINSDNVVLMRPRIDVRNFIADSDWLLQLSNDMESYCYSLNEALGYGVRIVRTPLSVAKELKIPKKAELVLDWDCGNVDEVAKGIFSEKKKFDYKPPKDGWNGLLVQKPSDYVYKKQNVRVRAVVGYYDIELGRRVSNWSESWETSPERAKKLYEKGLVRIIE